MKLKDILKTSSMRPTTQLPMPESFIFWADAHDPGNPSSACTTQNRHLIHYDWSTQWAVGFNRHYQGANILFLALHVQKVPKDLITAFSFTGVVDGDGNGIVKDGLRWAK